MTSTDLSKRLRKVTGLHAFAELFGFSWEDGSDWDWHDVACAMADAIDATVGGYAITFAPTLDRPHETMVGETVYDSDGNAIGWITSATAGVGTCKRIYHPNRITKTCTCSNCGYGASDKRWAYCPKCGHKYVHGEVEEWWESAGRKVAE